MKLSVSESELTMNWISSSLPRYSHTSIERFLLMTDEDDGIVTVGTQPEPRPEPSSQRRHHPSGCEDEAATSQSRSSRSPQSSPTVSPVSDRVRDMRLSHTTLPGGGLPPGRSFAMTSGAMVMTGDLLGMTTDDHLDAARPLTNKVDLSLGDRNSITSTDPSRNADQVEELADSQTCTSSESHEGSNIPEIRNRNPLSESPYRRNVIGAELPSDAPKPRKDMFSLLDLESDTELITDELLPDFPGGSKGRLSLGMPAEITQDQNGNISPSMSRKKVDHEGNDLEELANLSAHINRIQNENFTERPKTTSRVKTQEPLDDLGPSPFQRNTDKRGSFRDVEQSTLTSFINSSLQGLAHSLGALSPVGFRTGAKSPIRSRSPHDTQTTVKPANVSAAEIIARYKVLKENRAATSSQKSQLQTAEKKGDTNKRTISPLPPGLMTPDRAGSPLNEVYLQRTPTKPDMPLTSRFTLNLDDEPDLSTPPGGSGRQIDYRKLGISPLVSPESPIDDRVKNKPSSPLTTPTRKPKPPGKKNRAFWYRATYPKMYIFCISKVIFE